MRHDRGLNCDVKRSNLNAIAIDLYIVDRRCAWLSLRFDHTILPAAIGKYVERRYVIRQQKLRAFGNGNRLK